jgi:hypothetical protein
MTGNDEALVTYCGLCCLDCHGHQQTIPDLARDLRNALREAKYDKFAAAFSETGFGKLFRDYDTCYDVLGAMVKFRCHKGCRNGGGPPFCKIRGCCTEKKIAGCWQCADFERCDKLDFLQPVHGEAHIKNLKMLKKKGTAAFVDGKRHW